MSSDKGQIVKIEVTGYIFSTSGQTGCPTGIVITTTYSSRKKESVLWQDI